MAEIENHGRAGSEEIDALRGQIAELGQTVSTLTAANEKLEKEKRFFDVILDTIEAMILVLNPQGRVEYANRVMKSNTGYSTDGANQTSISTTTTLSDEEKALYAERIRRMVAGERPLSWENWAICKDGSSKMLSWNSTVTLDAGNNLEYIFASGIDITKRFNAEEALHAAKDMAESATKIKDQFVALVSHDLRSPLSSLALGLGFAISKGGDNLDPAVHDMLVKCLNNVNGLLGMTERLLDINRLQTGNLKPNKVFINAKELVSQVYFRLAGMAQDKKITLTNDIPAGRKVFADNVLFQQVIQNLVANAIKYCREGDIVTVSIAPGSPNIIVVKDTGVGVSPKVLPYLFNAEVSTTTLGTKGEKGTGFGLPLCHNIMKAHGGDLRVESTPGAGSAFYVELQEFKAIALVVDDQRVVRDEVTGYLARMGVEVVEGENGQTGYEKAIQVAPQLIITDIAMPVMDGLDMLDKLKSQPATTYIPVVVMTSSEDTVELRRDVFSRGAADFINKPLVPADFVPRIQRFVTS
jgi:PAS domain S-box-containing protein